MSDPMLDGVLDVVATEEPALHDKTAPVKTETKTEAPKTETKTETKTKEEVDTSEDDDEVVPDEQDFSRPSDETKSAEEEKETPEPSKTETETKTEAETPDDKWEPALPKEPEFHLEAPNYNEEGYITNMTPQQYEDYVVAKAQFQMQKTAYVQTFENQALDAAEKILPQIRTSQAVRTLVENARTASILTGTQINSFEAAKIVKEALGLSSTEVKAKVAEAKAAGAQNAKASITIQKNAAVETPSKPKPSNSKSDNLTKRLKQGEDSAFAELLDSWDKDGKLS